MAGNFLAGLVWGGLVAGLGLAVISPMAPHMGPKMAKPAEEPVVEAAMPGVPEPAPAETKVDVTAVTPELQPPGEPMADTKTDAILLPAQPEVSTVESNTQSDVAAPAVAAAPEAAIVDPGATATSTGSGQAMSEPTTPDPAAEITPAPAVTPEPVPSPAPAPAEPALSQPETAVEPAPAVTAEATPAPAPAESPEVAPAPTEPVAAEPTTEVAPPVDPTAGVTTNRLPTIGKSDSETSSADAALPNDAADAPPLVRFARPFENLTGNPPMAILLIDDGADGVDRAALAALPFAVTFVIDPLAFNAPEAAAIYREAGQEIAILATGIPDGATASDLEQTFQTHDAVLPEAIAYVDLAQGGFQGNRPLATEVVTTLAPRGRGLVTYDQGLNAADQVAQRNGMPKAVIFRSLDAEGEATPVVRRYLDRAAFKAAQEGGAIVIGQARPETVAALIEWSVEGRSSAVSIAPLSVMLQVTQ